MTAEIAVMNKSAVALAADSAVTIQHRGGQKIYNTVNKLFALSQTSPVGIMIYGSAEITGVPWETLIRIYQGHLGSKKFGRLDDYAKHFFSFLDRKNPFFPKSQQDRNFRGSFRGYLRGLREAIEEAVGKEIAQQGKCSASKHKQLIAKIILSDFKKWQAAKKLNHLPKAHRTGILNRYRATVGNLIREIFEKAPLSNSDLKRLRAISGDLFFKNRFPTNCSGIVIAGFGEEETFPAIRAYEAEAVMNDRLKYTKLERKSTEIDFKTTASIVPFAQDDVVVTFIEGTDPRYQTLLLSHFSKILSFYPNQIAKKLKVPQKQKTRLVKALTLFGKRMQRIFSEQLNDYRLNNHVDPLLDVVDVLPKDELAAMAESLVNLTCLKRKMSLGAETVGGPIDVAVISKGEGLIWIKRKHYFKKDLNPQFFVRYND
jgi:hypothetical protein